MTCAPSFFPGPWDAVVVPVSAFFSTPLLRQGKGMDLIVYGPAHLLRKSWLSGVRDYLKEPWLPDELFLRLRGPLPTSLKWSWGERLLSLNAMTVAADTGFQIKLSRTEADILRLLVQRQGVTVSRNVLSWAAECSSGRVVDTLVARLRRKLQSVTGLQDDPIPSVRGLGYRLP